jgi:hypothetical protein
MMQLTDILTRDLLRELLTRTDRAEGLEAALLPTAALEHELLSRFDHAVFMGMRVGVTPAVNEYHRKWKGNSHVAAGLAADVQTAIIHAHAHDSVLLGEEGAGG